MPLGLSQCLARAGAGLPRFSNGSKSKINPGDWRKRANKPDKRLKGKPEAKIFGHCGLQIGNLPDAMASNAK